ncbi:MAG: universal stress protein [Deltaproteobacteria bacterium]|nr:universal stress protein [Deltaproteobacteria bacterium]
MKVLIYTDGKPASGAALRLGATLAERLDGETALLTVRAGTPATEEPPPVGVDVPQGQWSELQPGIQILSQAMVQLSEMGFIAGQQSINIREVRSGYLFLGSTPSGSRVPFYERYGHLIELLNHEIDQHQYDLVVVAPPKRSSLGRFVAGDKARHMALELHSSVLMARGGDWDGRFLVCADGSPSARRLFPLLKQLLPAVCGPVDLIWVREPDATEEETEAGNECVQRARAWLDSCGKEGDLLLREGERPEESILEEAGGESVIVMGGSLRHDVHHRVRGSLPLQVLAKTESSVLLAKLPPEVGTDFFEELDTC